MSENLYLVDIHVSNNLIILYLNTKIIRLWYYNVEELKYFLTCILNRYKYDIGIVTTLNINNRNRISNRFLQLVYSSYYRYENDKCIESMLSRGAENDTITLFITGIETINFKLDSNSDTLFNTLLYVLNSNINRRISNISI
jgi:hypothetical protein